MLVMTQMISQRKCHLIGLDNENINTFVSEIKYFLENERIPTDYVVNVYKDAVTCCGYFPIGVTVEIEGPEKDRIRDLDLRIYAKIIEICERKSIEHHECTPLEII